MRVLLPLLLTFPALGAARQSSNGIVGGWSSDLVTDENTHILTDALSGNNYSTSLGQLRVCFSEIISLETQVVAGTNYCFRLNGCAVTESNGKCPSSTTCETTQFMVQIFQQTRTNTIKVSSIKPVDPADTSSNSCAATQAMQPIDEEAEIKLKTGEFSEYEKKQVDDWIQANGLNEYGDKTEVMYMGGTPLFNESTGTTTNLYAYICSRHPNRPWLSPQFEVKKAADETL